MVGRDFFQGDCRCHAFFLRKFAARSERTTWNRLREIRRSTRNRVKLLSFFVERRNRFLQRLIIRMLRLVKNPGGGGALHKSSCIHYKNTIAKNRNDADVVRDENHSGAELA